MIRFRRLSVACLLFPLPLLAVDPVPPPKSSPFPNVGSKVQEGRRTLANYRWRVKTEMMIDGEMRVTKLEDVHLNPKGGLDWDKTVRYERLPDPTPFPYADPRRSRPAPPSAKDQELYFEQAYGLLQLYAQVSDAQVSAWASKAQITKGDPEREGLTRLRGRGLVRPFDETVVYIDPATHFATEVEVKTTVSDKIREIAFIRLTLEPLPGRLAGDTALPVIAPKKVFLNMNRGKRQIVLEMTFSDFRKWN